MIHESFEEATSQVLAWQKSHGMPGEKRDAILVQFTTQMAESVDAEFGGLITRKEVPKEVDFINFHDISKILSNNITKVAYCGNLMCFVFFYEGGCSCVKQTSLRAPGGLDGYCELMEPWFKKRSQ